MDGERVTLQSLVLTDPSGSGGSIVAAVASVPPITAQRKGTLAFLVSVPGRADSAVARLVSDTITDTYYRSAEFHAEADFELALRSVNEKIADLLAREGDEWLAGMSAAVILVNGSSLTVATVGEVIGVLIRAGRLTPIADESSIGLSPNPLKVFSSLTTGTLVPGDSLFFGTPSFLNFFSLEKLKRLVSEHEPAAAVDTLGGLLEGVAAHENFGAVVGRVGLQASAEPAIGVVRRGTTDSHASMEELLHRERATETILSPKITPSVSHWMTGVLSPLRSVWRRLPIPHRTPTQPESAEYWTRRGYRNYRSERLARESKSWSFIRRMLWGVGRRSLMLVALIIDFFRGKRVIRANIGHVPRTSLSPISKALIRFRALPRSRKVVLIAGIVLVYVFFQSIYIIGSRREHARVRSAVNVTLETVTDLDGKVKAALLYGDEEGAKTMVRQGRELLETVPDKKEYHDQVTSLSAMLEGYWEQTKHLITITDPTVVTSLSPAAPRGLATATPASVVAFNESPPGVTVVSTEDGATKTIELAEPDESVFTKATTDGAGATVLMLSGDVPVEYNAGTGTLTRRQVNFENQDRTVASVAVYNGRLYTLDTKNNQIFRHNRAGNGWATGTAWLTESIDVAAAVDIAIDGSLYLLYPTGVTKATQGTRAAFTLSEIDPPLFAATSLFTTVALDRLFIAEPASKRVLVFSKEGRLISQLYSESFSDLRDIAVVDSTVYVLAGSTVYALEVPVD